MYYFFFALQTISNQTKYTKKTSDEISKLEKFLNKKKVLNLYLKYSSFY